MPCQTWVMRTTVTYLMHLDLCMDSPMWTTSPIRRLGGVSDNRHNKISSARIKCNNTNHRTSIAILCLLVSLRTARSIRSNHQSAKRSKIQKLQHSPRQLHLPSRHLHSTLVVR